MTSIIPTPAPPDGHKVILESRPHPMLYCPVKKDTTYGTFTSIGCKCSCGKII